MTISASETLIRYLGPSEAYFWLSNQNSWKHFVVAAQITGETTTASWRTALDAGVIHYWESASTRTTVVPRIFASFPSCAFHFRYFREMRCKVGKTKWRWNCRLRSR